MRLPHGGLSPPEPIGDAHDVSGFACGAPALDLWLRQHARPAAIRRTANTFVFCRGERVVGYYSLANGAVAHGGASAKVKRNTPDPIPATVLARLAVSTSEQGHGLGRDLLIDAFRKVLLGARFTAARLVIVHPIDDGAAAFYAKYGFRPLGGGTTALYLPVETLGALPAIS